MRTDLPSFASHNVKDGYTKLKFDLQWIAEFSGSFWNWPVSGIITASTFKKIFAIQEHLNLTKDVNGCVCEFGTHILSKLKVIRNLLAIYPPPRAKGKQLFGFDHFKGYLKSAAPQSEKFFYNNSSVFEVKNSSEVWESLDRFNTATKKIYSDSDEISLIEGRLPKSYIRRQTEIGPISLCYFDLQDVSVMSKLVPKVLINCSEEAILIFEGYGLEFFPKVKLFVDRFIQETESIQVIDCETSIPFTKVVQVRGSKKSPSSNG